MSSMKLKINFNFFFLCSFLFIAALTRFIPHPPNFTAIGAMTLFSVAYFQSKRLSFFMPILTFWISDLALNNIIYAEYYKNFVLFGPSSIWNYLSLFIISIIGYFSLKEVKVLSLLFTSVSAACIFFLLSNFGVWFSTNLYPKTVEGLINCYVAGIPFFRNTLAGNLVYGAILFGVFEYTKAKYLAPIKIKK